MGEIKTATYTTESKGRIVYNSAAAFFERTASKENFKSNRFMELSLEFATDTSTRKAAARINRIRLESVDGVSPTTYRNIVEREGRAMQLHAERKCEGILVQNGFDNNGALNEKTTFIPDKKQHIEQAVIEDSAINLNILNYNANDYDLPKETVNISIDDVCVKRQTETRPKGTNIQQAKRVDNTVIHVEADKKSYILNSGSPFGGIKLLIGFLLSNDLLKKQLVIFTDGARTLHGTVEKMLSFTNYKIILDWYHLNKKCKEQLSMALKGRKIRNDFLSSLMPCLWFGNVDGAIKLLRH